MSFNLQDYEDVATLNKWFQDNYPMGSMRILELNHEIIYQEGIFKDEIITAVTGVFRDSKDEEPAVSNLARGRQSEYPKHMQRFFAEDVVTSSFGRCIALLKGADKTATKDDMQKVVVGNNQPIKPLYGAPGSRSAAVEMALRGSAKNESFEAPKLEEPAPVKWTVDEVVDSIGASTPNEPPVCCNAGHTLKQGISKGGKPYYGYVCNGKITEHAKWASITSNGKWYFKGDE